MFLFLIIMETKAKTRKQLADQYGICRRTFNRWLKENGIKLKKGLITPKDQELIHSIIGYPQSIEKNPSQRIS
jgi:hypothetical protein